MSLSPWPGLTEFGPPVIQADGTVWVDGSNFLKVSP